MLDNCLVTIVRGAISNHSLLERVLHALNESRRRTLIGQLLDCNTNIECFNWEHYKTIVANKSSQHAYYMPIQIGFYLANKCLDEFGPLHALINKIGFFLQVRIVFRQALREKYLVFHLERRDLYFTVCFFVF